MLARVLNGNPPPAAIQDPLRHRHPLDRPQPAGPQLDRAEREEGLHLRPSQDHPGGEPPLLPDSGASGLRKGQGYGRPHCPGHEAGLSGVILLYAPALDRHLENMTELADRVFCFYDMEGSGLRQGRRISEELASQTT